MPRITGKLRRDESSGKYFVITADHKQRNVAKSAQQNAEELLGQQVTGEFTPQGLIDLRPLAEIAAAVTAAPDALPTAGRNEFFNPYTFIPAPRRKVEAGAFGDGGPVGHDRYLPDRWTGRIRVNLEVRSPLIMTDAGAVRWEGDHGIYPTRLHKGTPIIPGSSVKGMLRAAFESVTASRFGLFDDKHKHPLAFRQQANRALRMVPARVTDDGKRLELLTGTTRLGRDGRVPDGEPQYAAWLPAYHHGAAITLGDLGLTEDGPRRPIRLKVNIRRAHKNGGGRAFDFWQVTEILEFEDANGGMVKPQRRLEFTNASTGRWVRPNTTKTVEGWLHWTNRNFSRKHDERVFFTTSEAPPSVEVTGDLHSKWTATVASSVDAHRLKEITGRHNAVDQPWKHLGDNPGSTAWSPHLYDKDRQELGPGSLCYVTVNTADGILEVTGLHPVMIGRELFETSPRELAENANILPPTTFEELSPAEKVFGWVRAGKGDDQAVRGHVRIGFVETEVATVSSFDGDGIPLSILSGPKPTQARFYAAANLSGEPLSNGSPKKTGYATNGGLRGRKVYPPHRVGDDHWEDPTNLDRAREFQRTGGTRDGQNRSVTSWIDCGSQFHFDVFIDNLTDAELGALLHVLDLDDDACLRLGAARPLGLGSVHLEVDWKKTTLHAPDQILDRFSSLLPSATRGRDDVRKLTSTAFIEALSDVLGANDMQAVLDAFAVSVHGGEGPVHYPRTTGEPDPEGQNYEWFTRNEKVERGNIADGRGLSLPAPYGPLPFHE